MKHSAWLPLLGAIVAVKLQAQSGASGGMPSIGGAQSGVQANQGSGAKNDPSRGFSISGKVVMQDGVPVPQNVTIQRVCSGISKVVAYTDAGGRFSFHWSDRDVIATDASDAGSGSRRNSDAGGFGGAQSAGGTNTLAPDPFGNRPINCAVRAELRGFTSSTIPLFDRAAAGSPDVGLIVLHRVAGVEGSSVSVTSMRAPRDAKKAYERGLQSLLKNTPGDAERDFEKAVQVYPGYADAWVSLAKLRLARQAFEAARAALLQAMASDPKLLAPYLELGLLAAKDAKWEESGRYLDRAVELDPLAYPQAWYADAVANYNLGKYDEAEKGARAAVRLDPKHVNPRSGYLLGMILVEKKDFANAAAELTAYLELAPHAPDLAQVQDQLAQLARQMDSAKQPVATRP